MVGVNADEFKDKLAGRKGIIYFKDYWQRAGEEHRSRSGDHIDLWNGSSLTSGWSWWRIHVRVGSFGAHSIFDVSDYEQAKAVWFWRVL